VKNHRLARITDRLRVANQPHYVAACRWRVFTVMTAVQGADDLAEDAPDKLLLAHLVLVLQVPDDTSEVAIAAVFHVEVQVLRCLDVITFEVGDDVGMSELFQNRQLCLELLALLLRHLEIADFLAAEDLGGGLAGRARKRRRGCLHSHLTSA
jgi:hypothetical protein